MNPTSYDELAASLTSRLAHVNDLGQQLATAIQTWVAAEHFGGEAAITDDRLSWELRLTVAEPPPLSKWGLVFGSAISDLRSTLDNLLWGVAAVEGISLEKPKLLQFPIAESAAAWANEARRIAQLPTATQAAVQALQPFQRSGGADGLPENDPLLLLQRLSNTHKHRVALLPIVSPEELQHSFTVEFRSEQEAAADGEPKVHIDPSFKDGAVLVRQVTTHPIAKVKGSYEIKARAVVLDPPHPTVALTGGLDALLQYVDQVGGYVLNATRSASSH